MARQWYFLIHQIPLKPLYLRAKIRLRLAKAGAIPLKNSVYVLPCSSESLEDFQWIAEEVTSGGGQAWICGGEVLGGTDDETLVQSFHAVRDEEYGQIRVELLEMTRMIDGERTRVSSVETQAMLNRLRERCTEIQAIDFFGSAVGKEVSGMIRSIQKKVEKTAARRAGVPKAVLGRTWVTRAGMKIDRIASSWLIRRYIDPDARFRFVDATSWSKAEQEIAFDIVGGDYSHEADRCTFETLAAKFAIHDRAVTEIAEIVHDIDLKDGKFGRSDAPGIQLLIQGLVAAHPSDEVKFERGLALFDDLAQSFATPPQPSLPREKRTTQKASKKRASK